MLEKNFEFDLWASLGKRVQALDAVISEIVWVDKR